MQLVICFGTGRCGSKSLAAFLDKQPGFDFTHEGTGITFDPILDIFDNATEKMEQRGADFVGDASPMWLNYISRLYKRYPDVKLIWLDRGDVDEVVESFHAYKQHDPLLMQNNGCLWYMYPVLEQWYSREAIERTVRRYTQTAYVIEQVYPDNVYRLKMNDLVHRSKQKHLLNWLGLPKESHVYGMPHLNKLTKLQCQTEVVEEIKRITGTRGLPNYDIYQDAPEGVDCAKINNPKSKKILVDNR